MGNKADVFAHKTFKNNSKTRIPRLKFSEKLLFYTRVNNHLQEIVETSMSGIWNPEYSMHFQ